MGETERRRVMSDKNKPRVVHTIRLDVVLHIECDRKDGDMIANEIVNVAADYAGGLGSCQWTGGTNLVGTTVFED
jgi:hypothetical protein